MEEVTPTPTPPAWPWPVPTSAQEEAKPPRAVPMAVTDLGV